MSDTSGRLFEMPYATWDPDSSCWKTSGAISRSGSGKFSGTWPTSGLMRDGACFEHPTWGHPTSAPAYSLLRTLPTPTSQMMDDRTHQGGNPTLARAILGVPEKDRKRHEAAGRLLPTPRSNEANGTGDHGTGGPDLRTLVDQLLPTPTARDHKDGRECDVPENALLGRVAWRFLPTPRAQNGEDRNSKPWLRPLDQPQNLENAIARMPGVTEE